MRKKKIGIGSIFLLVFAMTSILLVGCNSSFNDEDTSLKEVKLSSIKDKDYFSTESEADLLNKVFLIENSSGENVVFYKMNIDNESVTYSVKDSVLEINVVTSGSKQNTLAYKIIHPKEKDYDTIKLIIDGEESSFASVIL